MLIYTIREAAEAIAWELCADDETKRASVAAVYRGAIYDALCNGSLVGRRPDCRLMIQPGGLESAIAFSGSVMTQADLNTWLDRLGVGVKVTARGEPEAAERSSNAETDDRPTSRRLAADLGPFLTGGRDRDWLRSELNDASRRHPQIEKYRRITNRSATWDVGGVVLYLFEKGYLKAPAARRFFDECAYPNHRYVLDHLPTVDGPARASAWYPPTD